MVLLRKTMKSTECALVFIVPFLIAACGAKSEWTPKSALPANVAKALPYRGFLLSSGGGAAPAERISVELREDRKTISEVDYGPAIRLLSQGEADRVTELAAAVSAAGARPTVPNARLILTDKELAKEVGPSAEAAALGSYVRDLIEEGKSALALAVAEAEKHSERYRSMGKPIFQIMVYPDGDPTRKTGTAGHWHVTFEPGMTDSEISCIVNLKTANAECRAHYE